MLSPLPSSIQSCIAHVNRKGKSLCLASIVLHCGPSCGHLWILTDHSCCKQPCDMFWLNHNSFWETGCLTVCFSFAKSWDLRLLYANQGNPTTTQHLWNHLKNLKLLMLISMAYFSPQTCSETHFDKMRESKLPCWFGLKSRGWQPTNEPFVKSGGVSVCKVAWGRIPHRLPFGQYLLIIEFGTV